MADLKKDFEKVVARAAALRLTETEVLDKASPAIGRTTYWRAKNGITGTGARVKVLRRVEAVLDQLEKESA